MTGCSVMTSEEERELHGAGEDRTLGGSPYHWLPQIPLGYLRGQGGVPCSKQPSIKLPDASFPHHSAGFTLAGELSGHLHPFVKPTL